MVAQLLSRRLSIPVAGVLLIDNEAVPKEKAKRIDELILNFDSKVRAYQYFGDELLEILVSYAKSDDKEKKKLASKALAGMHTKKAYEVKISVIQDQSVDETVRAELIHEIKYPLDDYEKNKRSISCAGKKIQRWWPKPLAEGFSSGMWWSVTDMQKFIDVFKKHSSAQVQYVASNLERSLLYLEKSNSENIKKQEFVRTKKRVNTPPKIIIHAGIKAAGDGPKKQRRV